MKYYLFFLVFPLQLFAQQHKQLQTQNNNTQTEKEIILFYDSYADDLRKHRREAITNRYDNRGYFRVGNGTKTFMPFEEIKKWYLTGWSGPVLFEWKNLSFEVLSPEAVVVTGLFDLQTIQQQLLTYSYSALLVKKTAGWRIRIEDESLSPLGYTTQSISGSPDLPGTYKYSLTAQPGASISAHRHSADQHIKVISGRKFILTGNLDTARVQIFTAGSSFVIPENTWHLEWWEEKTVENIERPSPWRTEFASPCSPRKGIKNNLKFLPVTKQMVSAYTGEYQHPTRATGKYRIFSENDTLKLSRNWDNYTSAILPVSETEFASVDGLYTSLVFADIENGKAEKMITTAQCNINIAKRVLPDLNKVPEKER